MREIEQFEHGDALPIPEDMEYLQLHSISKEEAEILHNAKPATVHAAGRLPGKQQLVRSVSGLIVYCRSASIDSDGAVSGGSQGTATEGPRGQVRSQFRSPLIGVTIKYTVILNCANASCTCTWYECVGDTTGAVCLGNSTGGRRVDCSVAHVSGCVGGNAIDDVMCDHLPARDCHGVQPRAV